MFKKDSKDLRETKNIRGWRETKKLLGEGFTEEFFVEVM